jgi:hypothetical protein
MSAFAVMTGMAANLSSSGAPFRGFLPLVDKAEMITHSLHFQDFWL